MSTTGEVNNTKIMVNFSARKIIHCKAAVGSKEYDRLLEKGYENVGTMKGEGRFFWNDGYFDPRAKYDNNPPRMDTITT